MTDIEVVTHVCLPIGRIPPMYQIHVCITCNTKIIFDSGGFEYIFQFFVKKGSGAIYNLESVVIGYTYYDFTGSDNSVKLLFRYSITQESGILLPSNADSPSRWFIYQYTFFQSGTASVHSNAATGTLFRQALWKFDTGARTSTLFTDLE